MHRVHAKTKLCPCCGTNKPLSEFNRHSGRSDGVQSNCRDCLRQHQRDWYKDNKAKHIRNTTKYRKTELGRCKMAIWQSRSRAKHGGFTPILCSADLLLAQLRKQEYKCCFCGKHDSDYVKGLHADHDHVTGVFRGWLCHPCNTRLGAFE